MKTAILLIAYKKFDILNQVIDALAKNKHYDLIVNFDNHDELDQYELIKNKILSYFPNAIISMRPKKFGVNLNIICSIYDAFYTYGYDRIFYIEDDIYCNPTCLETLEDLMNWTDKNLDNVGMVQSWNYNIVDPKYTSNYYHLHGLTDLNYSESCSFSDNEVAYTYQNFWGCLISKKCWDIINPYVLNHFISQQQGKGFNFGNYQNLIVKLINAKCTNEIKSRIISRFNIIGWEPIVDLAMTANDLYKIALTNPRSKTIGEIGDSSTTDMFTSVGLDKIELNKSSIIPNEFILNKQSKELWINN
jgi:hypothetical protein